MFRKSIALIMIVVCTLVCLPVFSSASEQQVSFYASIPRPEPTSHVKYILAQLRPNADPILFVYSVPETISTDDFSFFISCDDSVNCPLYLLVSPNFGFDVTCLWFNLDGTLINTEVITVPASSSMSFQLTLFDLGMGSFDPFDIPIYDNYGIFNVPRTSVAWSDNTDPSVYTAWLERINSKLNEIDNNTDNVEAQLSDISSQLSLFYSVFNSYQSQMLGNTATIITSLNTLNSRLNSFAQQNHYDLEQIYLMLSQIYALLSEEQQTRPPAIENESEVQNVLQNEAALNKDFSGELNQQFDVAGNIFESNSAFSFISNLFQELVLDVPALNSLVIFSLAIGLCVLILGRRLNA